nr:pitrilysin family protein [uncultured Bacteroides sp.]
MILLDRAVQPKLRDVEQLAVQVPLRMVMPNGVPLNVLDSGENEVVRIDLLMEGGRWQQSQPLQALFTNRMLREGTQRLSASEIAERLDYYGAWLELSSASEYAYITLYSLNKYLPQTLDILESIVKEPVFPEKELDVIINNNIQQFLVNSSKVDFLAHRALVKAVYGEQHPTGRLVEEEDYHRITPEVLREFYNRHYHSANCSIYLSGKVNDDCIRRIESLFGSEPFGRDFLKPEKKDYSPLSSDEKRIFVERADALQSAVRMGMLSMERSHPDYLKARVLVTLFGGYFGSRLMSNIREEKGYTYGISAGMMPYPGKGLLVVNAETANEFVEPLIGEVYHEIDRLQNELVSNEELTMVKNYMLGDTYRSYESAFSLADSWIFVQVSKLQDTYFTDVLDAIREVTPEEIRNLAGKHLCKEILKEVISGKKMS